MARSGSCPSCSAKLSKKAAYCPSCGQAIGVDLDLSALDEDDELVDDAPVAPERSPRTRNVLITGGLAVALIGGAVLVSRDDAETTAATDATTSSSSPRRSPRTTRETLPRPTTSVYLELVPKGPLLPEPTGTVLYGTTSDGQLARIELDTGKVSLRRLPGTNGEIPMQLIPRAGAIVAAGYPGSPSFVLQLDLKGDLVELSLDDHQLFRGPAPDELWRVSAIFTPDQARPRAQRMKLDGSPVGPELLLPLQVWNDDGAGRLIGGGFAGGLYVLSPDDGRPSLLTEGQVASIDAQRIVDVVCDEVLNCRWRVRERAGGEPRLLDVPPDPDQLISGISGTASPDGRWLVLADNMGRLQLLDLASGAMRQFGNSNSYFIGGPAVWSADGRWLFWSENGSLRAWHVGVSEPVRIGGGSTPSLNMVVAVPA